MNELTVGQPLYPVNNGNQWGFCNKDIELKIPYQFDAVSMFHEGIAVYQIGHLHGYVKANGEKLTGPEFISATPILNGYGFIMKDKDTLYSLIGHDGKIITPQAFHEETVVSGSLIRDKSEELWGFRNIKGEFVIAPKYKIADDFSEGFALVSSDGQKFGYINIRGEKLTEEIFELDIPGYTFNGKPFPLKNRFSEGLATVKINDLYGYLNKKGDLQIAPRFRQCGAFAEGLAAVMIDGLWGFINQKGNMVIEPRYASTGSFYNGKCLVTEQKGLYDIQWQIIDSRGKIVTGNFDYTPLSLHAPPVFCGDLLVTLFYKEEVWGYIDLSGKVIYKSKRMDWYNNYPMYVTKYY